MEFWLSATGLPPVVVMMSGWFVINSISNLSQLTISRSIVEILVSFCYHRHHLWNGICPGIGKKQLYVDGGSAGGALFLLPVPIPSDPDGDFVEQLQRHEHDKLRDGFGRGQHPAENQIDDDHVAARFRERGI